MTAQEAQVFATLLAGAPEPPAWFRHEPLPGYPEKPRQPEGERFCYDSFAERLRTEAGASDEDYAAAEAYNDAMARWRDARDEWTRLNEEKRFFDWRQYFATRMHEWTTKQGS